MRRGLVGVVLVSALVASSRAGGPRFLPDDPLTVEPETQDAGDAAPRDIDLVWDLAENLFGRPGDRVRGVRAQNVNTIDEVPDSGWFTNRIHARPMTVDAIGRGPLVGDGPAPGRWTITHPKSAGFAPGFRIRDSAGTVWFVSLDAAGFPESATGALAVANKLFWALGYYQVENHLTSVAADQIDLAPTARIRAESGRFRPMRRDDVDAVLARAARDPDGRYRAIASRGLPGKILGGFEYHGTRPDDPNDVVPHEHRRELRALKVFGAWVNLVDMKAGNTLDTVVPGPDGRRVVRHYLQDIGSTFGAGANGPREFDEGWESLLDGPQVLARLFTIGLYMRPWQRVRYQELPAVGRFEGDAFDPRTWSPRVPPAAFRHARADDEFWAARRVMAFSDALIRAAVRSGGYSDVRAEQLLGDVLIKRRDAIGRAYLPALTPLADFAFDTAGGLTFANVAAAAGVAAAPRDGYRVQWLAMDNATGETTPLGDVVDVAASPAPPPGQYPPGPDAVLTARVWAEDPAWPSWRAPVDASFMRRGDGWRLVGVDRQP
jgi:hypothetical protein